MGNTRPECFLRGLKSLGENLRGLKSISKFDHFFFQNFYLTFEGLIYIVQKPLLQLHYTTMMRKYDSSGVRIFLVK